MDVLADPVIGVALIAGVLALGAVVVAMGLENLLGGLLTAVMVGAIGLLALSPERMAMMADCWHAEELAGEDNVRLGCSVAALIDGPVVIDEPALTVAGESTEVGS